MLLQFYLRLAELIQSKLSHVNAPVALSKHLLQTKLILTSTYQGKWYTNYFMLIVKKGGFWPIQLV